MVWKWLMSLDPPTRAAFIGGFATVVSVLGAIIGVYLNLAWNRKRHNDEKATNLRREAYINAIAAMHRGISYLHSRVITGKAENKTLPNDAAELPRELSLICAQLHILGSRRVVAAVVAFETKFDHWLTTISATQRLSDELDKGHNDLVQQVKHGSDEVAALKLQREEASGVLVQWKPEAPDHGGVSEQALKKAAKSWKETNARLEELKSKVEAFPKAAFESATQRYENILKGVDRLFAIRKDFSPLVNEVTVAMKADLGLPTDERWYKEAMTKEFDRATIELAETVETSPAMKTARSRLAELRIEASKQV
jgi:hypothetical protein